MRWLIWIYLLLLLFEGALRKWILPQFSSPLLIIRDPLVIVIYAICLTGRLLPTTRFLRSLCAIALFAAIFGLVAEQFRFTVFAFGFRSNFLHLPLIFVMATVLRFEDVAKMGKWILILSIPMAYLVVRQFSAAPDDILNVGVGAGGAQLATSGGKVRASGTFSFITGVVAFYSTVAAFLIHSLIRSGTVPRWVQFAGGAGLVAAIATSGSRALFISVAVVLIGVLLVVLRRPQLLARVFIGIAFLALVTGTVLQLGVMREGVEVLTARFDDAGGHSGIWPRLAQMFSGPLYHTFNTPLGGYGLGLGTNAGAALITGRADYLLAEDEWSRVIMESGPIVGNLFIIWRIAFVWRLFQVSMRAVRVQNVLPLLLLSSCGFLIVNGQFGQPTTLGFAVIGGGLCLASARPSRDAQKQAAMIKEWRRSRAAGMEPAVTQS